MMEEFCSLEITRDGEIAVIKFNRPKALNALNRATLQELARALDFIEKEDAARGVILTGEGKAFAAGADISEFVPMNAQDTQELAAFGQEKICDRIENFSRPVIAAINGYALGGGNEIAMACDIRIASTEAVFSQPEAALGILPLWGAIKRLEHLVGPSRAKELILTCRKVDAAEAAQIGLVNRVVAPEKLMTTAKETLQMILKNAPLAVYLGKLAVNCAADMNLAEACKLERELGAVLFSTQDRKEGMSAFLEKRQAKYTGR